jgi:hypothetical protein
MRERRGRHRQHRAPVRYDRDAVQRVVPWQTGIVARWYRANELLSLAFGEGGLVIDLVEEGTEQNWRLVFAPHQAHRVTTEECRWPIGIENLPERGGFFEVLDSDWVRALGKGQVRFLDAARHFVVCCYDDIVEVVAHDCRITKLDRVGYPAGQDRIELDPADVFQGPPPAGDDPASKLLRLRLASRDAADEPERADPD